MRIKNQSRLVQVCLKPIYTPASDYTVAYAAVCICSSALVSASPLGGGVDNTKRS